MPESADSQKREIRHLTYVAAVALMRKGGEVLLVRQRGPGDERAYWGLPGGIVEPGETLIEGLLREVREEAGVEVTDPGRIAFVTHSPTCISFTFEVGEWRGEAGPADPDGFVLEAGFFPLNEAIARLEELPIRGMREPVTAYLRGQAERGTVLVYAKGLEEDPDSPAA
jgi:8-oxo-dGTP diphosphatase